MATAKNSDKLHTVCCSMFFLRHAYLKSIFSKFIRDTRGKSTPLDRTLAHPCVIPDHLNDQELFELFFFHIIYTLVQRNDVLHYFP